MSACSQEECTEADSMQLHRVLQCSPSTGSLFGSFVMLVVVAHRHVHVLCTAGWPTVCGVRPQACCHVPMHQQRLCPSLLPRETVCTVAQKHKLSFLCTPFNGSTMSDDCSEA